MLFDLADRCLFIRTAALEGLPHHARELVNANCATRQERKE